MRRLHTPYEGYLTDGDMFLHVRPRFDDTWQNDALYFAPIETFDVQGGIVTLTQHVLDPRPESTNPVFDSSAGVWLAQASVGDLNAQAALTNASVGWSMVMAYDFTGVSTASQRSIIEYSVTPNGSGANGWPMRLYWRPDSRDFVLEWRDAGASTRSLTSAASLPARGLLGLDSTRGNRSIDWYHNGRYVSTASRASNEVTPAIGTSASARFVVGGSIAQGTDYSTPLRFMDGVLGDFAFWRGPRGAARHAALYGQSIRPWDENQLLSSTNYRAEIRALVRDSDDTEWVDLTSLSDNQWVLRAEITRSVDNQTDRASLVLQRRVGEQADLSPLNDESPLVDTLQLRRRVRIDRAFVPPEHTMQGWEWDTHFEGLIESWDIEQDTISIDLLDRSAALTDAFILDSRAYNYANPNKASEAVAEEILDDFEPKIRNGAGIQTIGYKGEPDVPQVFTLAGTAATRHYRPSGNTLRYNDVASGPVFQALNAVTDMIGRTTRYRMYEPLSATRLTAYGPRRDKQIPWTRYTRLNPLNPREIDIFFDEPHELGIGAVLQATGTASHNFTGRVSEVKDYYQVTVESNADIAAGIVTTATLVFESTTFLTSDQILDVEPIKTQMGSIRNHAKVKFKRSVIPDLELNTTTIEVIGGQMEIQLREEFSPTFQLDADSSGFSFRLEGGSSTASLLTGTYAGKTGASNRAISATTPTTAPDGVYSSSSMPFLYTDWNRFREVTSTYTPSVQTYGLLPVGVYEGTSLAIDTYEEAQRLADALVSDLALPTADFAVEAMVRPIELHDVIEMPDDKKGRWRGTYSFAVVGITEKYESGQCLGTYELRASNPTLGVGWASGIAVSSDRPAPIDNYPLPIANQVLDSWRLQHVARRARSMTFNRQRIDRQQMGRRHDSTWVWMSTASVGFMPTQDNLVGRFRGDNIQITNEANGDALTPGTTYFVRVAEQDIWGNLSEATGLGTASAATVFAVIPRFLGESVGVQAASGGTTTLSLSSSFSVLGTDVDNSADPASVTFDTFNNFNTASRMFRAPFAGLYAASMEVSTANGTKASNLVRGRLEHLSSSAASLSSQTYTSATFASGVPLLGIRFSDMVYCESGDILRWQVQNPDSALLRPSTACRWFMRQSYFAVGQK